MKKKRDLSYEQIEAEPRLKEALDYAYKDVHSPIAFSTLPKLYNQIKQEFKNISKNTVENYLLNQELYTRYKGRKYKQKYRRVQSFRPWELLSVDLLDYSNIARANDMIRYLCNIYCCFSHYLVSVPLKSKNAEAMKACFDFAFNDTKIDKTKLHLVWSDLGSKFLVITTYLKEKYNVHRYSTYSKDKSSPIEATQKEIRKRIGRRLANLGTARYISFLPSLISAYNNEKRVFSYSPNEIVSDPEIAKKVKFLRLKSLVKFYQKNDVPNQFKKGDVVRKLLKKKNLFQKS